VRGDACRALFAFCRARIRPPARPHEPSAHLQPTFSRSSVASYDFEQARRDLDRLEAKARRAA